MAILSFLFWLSVSVVLYIYAGYPILIALIARILNREVRRSDSILTVSIIIPAHNEEAAIRETLENTLQLNYPTTQVEIIVVSDGSTDQTDIIVREFAPAGIRLLRQEPRQGKTAALNRAALEARGEILVFCDANSLFDRDALKYLVDNFADHTVGYVTGRMVYLHPGKSVVGSGCSAYMRYENVLRQAESRAGSLVGVNGGIDAVRKALFEPMRVDQQSDFILPLAVAQKGYRVIYDARAQSMETALERVETEYHMRVRVALRALNAIKDMRSLLDIRRFGIFSWQLFSHKLMRYFAFLPLIIAYASAVMLFSGLSIYGIAFILQSIFYFSAFLGWVLNRSGRRTGLLYVPFYFCMLNLASAHALWKAIRGTRVVLWQPRAGLLSGRAQ